MRGMQGMGGNIGKRGGNAGNLGENAGMLGIGFGIRGNEENRIEIEKTKCNFIKHHFLFLLKYKTKTKLESS